MLLVGKQILAKWARAGGLVLVVLGLLPAGAPAGLAQDGAAAVDPADINFSDVVRGQRKLLIKQGRALAPQRPGVTDLYFIGVGGEARQDVFLKEVRFTRALFDGRFGTEGRSMALVNNLQTVREMPLANIANLRLALNFVARTIDREEDVVFLFITSHGSRDHQLSLELPPLRLDNITGPVIRKLLDQSRIKWRVVVISACYAGGLVDDLRDDNSLIITAARADRTSFGCSSTAKFTYFGRAYFAEALTLEYSFVKAFAMAENSIRTLERERRFPESFPQMAIGSAIGPKLAEIEARLASTARLSAN